jgi:hypothetical protein
MRGPARDLPVDLDMPVPDREHAERLGLELADALRDRVARERETVRALREYLQQSAPDGQRSS